jgi:hypothetical protein
MENKNMALTKQDFARLVWMMREAQKAFYASKGNKSDIGRRSLLVKSKELEKLVDQELKDMVQDASQIGLGL